TFATVNEFNLSGCDSEVCRYYPGENISLRLSFVPSVNSSSLSASIKTEVDGVQVKFPGLESDGCKSPEVHCPLTGGSIVTYQVSYTVPESSDEITSVATFEMLDDRGQHLVCFKIPFEVSKRSALKIYRIKYTA
ncbi:hypothetical protein MXB_2757, partial [Myxobolus squamalis]